MKIFCATVNYYITFNSYNRKLYKLCNYINIQHHCQILHNLHYITFCVMAEYYKFI